MIVKPATRDIYFGSLKKWRSFCVSVLNKGRKNRASNKASIREMKHMMSDSPRNCFINDDLPAPITFLTPTSRARFSDRAVERFIKLMQAMNKMKMAIDASIYRYLIFPFALISLPMEERR